MRWVDGVSRRWRWGTADTESDSSRSLAPQAGTATDLSITADVACGVNDSCCLSTQNGNGVCDDCVDRDVRAASDGGSLQSQRLCVF